MVDCKNRSQPQETLRAQREGVGDELVVHVLLCLFESKVVVAGFGAEELLWCVVKTQTRKRNTTSSPFLFCLIFFDCQLLLISREYFLQKNKLGYNLSNEKTKMVLNRVKIKMTKFLLQLTSSFAQSKTHGHSSKTASHFSNKTGTCGHWRNGCSFCLSSSWCFACSNAGL